MYNTAIFWDWQNCRANQEEIRSILEKGKIVFKRAYSDWTQDGKKQAEILYSHGIRMINIPSYKDKQNRTDNELINDCRQEVVYNPDIDIVILVSGDGGYKKLVRELKVQGKTVIVIAKYAKSTNEKLKKTADYFYFFDQIAQLRKPWQLAS